MRNNMRLAIEKMYNGDEELIKKHIKLMRIAKSHRVFIHQLVYEYMEKYEGITCDPEIIEGIGRMIDGK